MFFSGILFGVSKTEYAARYFAPMTWTDKPPCRAVAGYMSPDREVNSALYRKFVSSGEAQPAPFVWFATRMKTAINYACILRTISDRHADADVISTSLDMRNQLLRASGNFPPIEKGLAVEIRYWEDDIHRLWQAAPARTEVVIPYVSWLISKGDKEKALEAIGRLDPSVKSDDPVSFWLHARRAELTGDTAGYKTLMTDALHRGLANLLPLSKAETSYFLGAQDKR
jgi:hypothetical protein